MLAGGLPCRLWLGQLGNNFSLPSMFPAAPWKGSRQGQGHSLTALPLCPLRYSNLCSVLEGKDEGQASVWDPQGRRAQRRLRLCGGFSAPLERGAVLSNFKKNWHWSPYVSRLCFMVAMDAACLRSACGTSGDKLIGLSSSSQPNHSPCDFGASVLHLLVYIPSTCVPTCLRSPALEYTCWPWALS